MILARCFVLGLSFYPFERDIIPDLAAVLEVGMTV